MSNKQVFISRDVVADMNEKHGWFQFRDAQSDVSNAFANEAIERYESIREAAPELLEACKRLIGSLGVMVTDPDSCDDIIYASAAINKALRKD